jgi:hypothetical protein
MGTRARWCVASGAVFFLALLQPARPEDMAGKPRELNTVLFGSLDGGRSVFASAGVKRTLAGSLDRDGFVFMAGAGAGGEPEREPLADVSFRPTAQAHALLGYQWMLGRAALSVLAGPEFDAELEAPTPGARRARASACAARPSYGPIRRPRRSRPPPSLPAPRASTSGAACPAAMPSGPACSSDRKHRSTCARIIANGVSAPM